LTSGASSSAERRNKAIAPYDPHFVSFNFLNPLICNAASSDQCAERGTPLTGTEGWRKVAQKGSHVQLKHPTKPGRVTVPHPKRDIPTGTLRSIEKQCGLKL
jgi:predicted RNA binding protein YcfA (HicA-like mRNA interferase family)